MAWRKLWSYYKTIFIGQIFNMMLEDTLDPVFPVSLPSQPSRSKDFILLFLLLVGLGNPSPWTICLASKHGNDYVFVVIDKFSNMAIFGCLEEEYHSIIH